MDFAHQSCSQPKLLVIYRMKGGKMAHKFEIYKDKSEEYGFRFRAPNGEVMFQGQGYKQKQSAKCAIKSIQKNAPDARVDDQI